jgi:hypothetical protein
LGEGQKPESASGEARSGRGLGARLITGERWNMRMMLKIVIPTETGNQAIKDGSLQKALEAIMSKLKPEAAYFFPDHGLRSAMMIFDMKDASEIPAIAEPLFAGLNARLQLQPVMNADDLKKGLDIARHQAAQQG